MYVESCTHNKLETDGWAVGKEERDIGAHAASEISGELSLDCGFTHCNTIVLNGEVTGLDDMSIPSNEQSVVQVQFGSLPAVDVDIRAGVLNVDARDAPMGSSEWRDFKQSGPVGVPAKEPKVVGAKPDAGRVAAALKGVREAYDGRKIIVKHQKPSGVDGGLSQMNSQNRGKFSRGEKKVGRPVKSRGVDRESQRQVRFEAKKQSNKDVAEKRTKVVDVPDSELARHGDDHSDAGEEEKADEPEVKVPVREGFAIVLCDKCRSYGLAHDDQGLVVRINGSWFGKTRAYAITDQLEDGMVVDGCKQVQPGWVEFGGDVSTKVYTCYYPDITINAYTDLSVDNLPVTKKEQVFKGLIRQICRKLGYNFGSSVLKGHTPNQLNAMLQQQYPEALEQVEFFFQHMKFHVEKMLFSLYKQRRELLEMPQNDDLTCIGERQFRNINRMEGKRWRWDGVDCIEKSYDGGHMMRDDVQFTGLRGCKLGPEGVPVFDTSGTGGRYYRTQFMKLAGDSEFQIYDVNATNMIRAMARVIRKRDDVVVTRPGGKERRYTHDDLVENQSRVAASLLRDGLINPKLCESLNTQVDIRSGEQFDTARIHQSGGNEVEYEVDLFNSNERWYWGLTSLMSMVRRRTTPSYMDKLVTLGVNARTTVYARAMEARTWLHDAFFVRDLVTDLEHPKKLLRRRYFNSIEVHTRMGVLRKFVEANIKKEIGKPGKLARWFMGYGENCISAAELPEYMKHAFLMPFHYTIDDSTVGAVNVTVQVVGKPSEVDLNELYRRMFGYLTSETSCIFTLIFSDDSVICGNINGRSFGMNVDISSCDSSNGWGVFAMVGSAMKQVDSEPTKGLLSQCCLPIKVKNPEQPSEGFTLKLSGPFEGSGTLLTTVLNHTASMWIAASVADMLVSNAANGWMFTPPQIAAIAGARVGHSVSCVDWCESGVPVFERMDFLKTHPVRDSNGEWRAMRCLGAMFRGFGSVDGDLTAIQVGMTPNEFMAMGPNGAYQVYAGGVVAGLKNEPSNIIMDAMRDKFCTKDGFVVELGVHKARSQKSFEADDESIRLRYGLSEPEVLELVSSINDIQIGMDVRVGALNKIFKKDYDLAF